jgi:hypothetical protein
MPYMAGTYLGTKKIWNIAAGFVHQKDAMWRKTGLNDTAYQAMSHFALESFLDMPLNKEKGNSISAFLGYFNTNYGTNYLRYNGIMNPANGTSLNSTNSITGDGPTYGNAYPMFGTGNVVYAQAGYLLPKAKKEGAPRWMPYASASFSKYDRLQNQSSNTFNAGINCLLNGHQAKMTLDWQSRPGFEVKNNAVINGERKSAFTFQYQIFF